jgi:hypothetical protein
MTTDSADGSGQRFTEDDLFYMMWPDLMPGNLMQMPLDPETDALLDEIWAEADAERDAAETQLAEAEGFTLEAYREREREAARTEWLAKEEAAAKEAGISLAAYRERISEEERARARKERARRHRERVERAFTMIRGECRSFFLPESLPNAHDDEALLEFLLKVSDDRWPEDGTLAAPGPMSPAFERWYWHDRLEVRPTSPGGFEPPS